MENYNQFIRNITKLIEKGLFNSKDLKKEVENTIKYQIENILNKFNFVSREEFEVQKKMLEKLRKDVIFFKRKKQKVRSSKKFKKVKKL